MTDRCAPKTLDHVWGTSVNAGEEAPLEAVLARFTFADVSSSK